MSYVQSITKCCQMFFASFLQSCPLIPITMAPTQVQTTIISLLDFISFLVDFLPPIHCSYLIIGGISNFKSSHVIPLYKNFSDFLFILE